jgi:hypothetical protein
MDIVAAPLLDGEVAVVVEAMADVAPRLAGERRRPGGSRSRCEGERHGEDAGHCPAAGPWPQRVLIDTSTTNLTVTEPLAERLLAQGFAREGPGVTVTLADGSERDRRTIIIDTVTIGSHVLRDVHAGVSPDGADMVLGLPVLNQIGHVTIDIANHKLIFG